MTGVRCFLGLVSVAVAACGSVQSPATGIDAGGTDAGSGMDAAPAGDASLCFGTFSRLCLQALPTQALMISQATAIDTSSSSMCVATTSGGDYCVIAATDITIAMPLRATGSRPLVLLATGGITTGAVIDVGSHRGATPELGAGADPAGCPAGTPPDASIGGGAGGSFAGQGGFGGTGVHDGGAPGAKTTSITSLRGGCPGQTGLDSQGAMSLAGGTKGHGGGAVYLIAGTQIQVLGGISAGGEGGVGGARSTGPGGGGGGGGSGGMIVLEAPAITGGSSISANGAGGGQGANPGSSAAVPGNGQDASTFAAAAGGTGGGGPQGGAGASGVVAGPGTGGGNGDQIDSDDAGIGGGGGGGGAGLVLAPATANLGTSVSPPLTTL